IDRLQARANPGLPPLPQEEGGPPALARRWRGGGGMMGFGGGMMGMAGMGGMPVGGCFPGGLPGMPGGPALKAGKWGGGSGMMGGQAQVPAPVVRRSYADTAYWSPALTTDANGTAEVSFKMPDNLTGWKVRVWAMGHGTRVGEGEAEIVTKKDLLVRLQAPRFFVEKDEVVLSANVHNYLKAAKDVRVRLTLQGGTLTATDDLTRTVPIPSGGERRIDWRVKVLGEAVAVVRLQAGPD